VSIRDPKYEYFISQSLKALPLVAEQFAGGYAVARQDVLSFMANLDRDSWFHRLDPRTKVVLVLGFSTVPLLFTDYRAIMFYMGLTLPLWLSANLDFRPLAGPLIGVGLFLMFIFLFNAIRGPLAITVDEADPFITLTWSYQLGPILFTSYSVTKGVLLAGRLMVPMTIGLLMVATTDPTHLAKGLKRLKMPAALVFMVLAALRFIPILAEQLFSILDAQTIRGVSRTRFERTKLVIMPLFLTSLRRVRALGMAVEAKGFRANRWNDFYEELRLERTDKVIMVGIALLIVASFIVRFGLGFGAEFIYKGR
jgi:energy-coupling factor transport system permease protein